MRTASNKRHFFFFQAEDGIRDRNVTGVQTCALPIWFAQKLHLTGYSELRSILRLSREEEKSEKLSLKEAVLANYHKMAEDVRKNDYSKQIGRASCRERV